MAEISLRPKTGELNQKVWDESRYPSMLKARLLRSGIGCELFAGAMTLLTRPIRAELELSNTLNRDVVAVKVIRTTR
jgi:hypothetical protein